jgi:hypothetical protein
MTTEGGSLIEVGMQSQQQSENILREVINLLTEAILLITRTLHLLVQPYIERTVDPT